MKWLFTALICFSLAGCSRDPSGADLQFAQDSFPVLARGDAKAEELIDFETLRMAGMDVGAVYAAMPNDKEKADFRRSFVVGFASSFQGTGASADSFKNWRVQNSDSARTVVATDGPKGVITITVSRRDDRQRISGLGIAPMATP
ncbi:MAG: hypothetical protein KY445_07845 [Armatimonadetes bacterium]|nr:hypothetical protein [Armatimonadota bacterium]